MLDIEVVRSDSLHRGYSTPGIFRNKAFETDTVLVSHTRLAGGAVSGWHHHGDRHLYGLVLSGRMRLEYGPTGKDAVEVSAGDFFHIPPRLIHRDVNPESTRETVDTAVLVGPGPPVINVDGP